MSKLNIAIIGGSISGCVLYNLLAKFNQKFNITIYEKSNSKLQDRGAGLTLQPSLVQELMELGVISETLPLLELSYRTFSVKEQSRLCGKEIWRQNAKALSVSWGDLFQNLRSSISNHSYKAGRHIKSLKNANTITPTLIFNDGTEKQYDFVIFADGYKSIGRRCLFPQSQHHYAGYIAWRGLVPAFKVNTDKLTEKISYYFCKKGHIIIYPIKAKNMPLLLNWVFYETMGENELSKLFPTNQSSIESLANSLFSKKHYEYLYDYAKQSLPNDVAEIVLKTEAPFLQVINDAYTPQYVNNRVLIVGDAAKTLRPHLGSGAVEALRQAHYLYKLLLSYSSLDKALHCFNQHEITYGKSRVNLGMIMGKALVTEQPLWEEMDASQIETWWQNDVMKSETWYLTDDHDAKTVEESKTSKLTAKL